jgi:tetratricopeptide (TPR) repeat protein
MIFERIERRDGGFDAFNAAIAAQLRGWLLATASGLLTLAASSADALDLRMGVAMLKKELSLPAEALACYEQCLQISEKSFGASSMQVAAALDGIAAVHTLLGAHAAALEHYTKSLAIYEHHAGHSGGRSEAARANLCAAKLRVADIYRLQENAKLALQMYGEAVKEQAANGGSESLAATATKGHMEILAGKLHEVACSHERGGEHTSAADCFDQCAATYTSLLGDDHPKTLEARRRAELAVLCGRNVLGDGEEFLETATAQFNLAAVWMEQGNFDGAIEHFSAALATREKQLGQHPQTAKTLIFLGDAELMRMRKARSLDDEDVYHRVLLRYGQALTIQEKVLGPGDEAEGTRLRILESRKSNLHRAAALIAKGHRDYHLRRDAATCLRKCSRDERARYIGLLAHLLDDISSSVQEAALLFFAQCTADERGPYLGQLADVAADLLEDPTDMYAETRSPNGRRCIAAMTILFEHCSADERALCTEKISEKIASLLCSKYWCDRQAAAACFFKCGAGERKLCMGQLVACLNHNKDKHPGRVLDAVVTFFRHFSAEERAGYLDTLAASLSIRFNIYWNAYSLIKCLRKCNVQERAPYMDRIEALLCDECEPIQVEALSFFSSCSVEERAPYMHRLGALLGDKCAAAYPNLARVVNPLYGATGIALLRMCTADERRPFMARIAALINEDSSNFQPAFVTLLADCSADEIAPYLGHLATFIDDFGVDGRYAVDRHHIEAALGCFSVCGADKRAPYLERLAALFDLYDDGSKSHPAREAVLTFFSSCGANERAPYLEQLAALLDRDNIARELACGCSWRLIPTKKVLEFFSTCGADERAPYLDSDSRAGGSFPC